MATASASDFNASIGSLRGRSNNDANFAKAMSDRMAMIKFDAPSDNQARINQIQSKLGSTTGALKGISDIKDTGVKMKTAYNKVKSAGQRVVSSVGDAIGEDSGRVPQSGVRSLTTDKLPDAKIKVKTKTKPSNLGPSGEQQPTKTTLDPSVGEVQNPSGDAGKQATYGKDGAGRLGGTTDDADAVRALDPTKGTIQTTLAPQDAKTGPMGGDGKTDTPEGQMGGDGKTDTPTQIPKDQLPDVGPIGDGGSSKPSATSLTQTADDSIATGQRGDQTIARTLGSRSRAVTGAGQEVSSVRSNAMNVSSMTSADQTANSTLGNLTSSLRSNASNIAGHVPTGNMAETSTNIHASIGQALEDFKGQIGGALSDVQEQVKGVAGQVSQVGRGVSAVGEDVASGASKAVEGISAGLETAGAVADALGPIGDLIGLGMSIFGGVEEHKEHEQEKQANQQAQQTIAQKPEESTQQSTSVSLDTSKQAQASVASHY